MKVKLKKIKCATHFKTLSVSVFLSGMSEIDSEAETFSHCCLFIRGRAEHNVRFDFGHGLQGHYIYIKFVLN